MKMSPSPPVASLLMQRKMKTKNELSRQNRTGDRSTADLKKGYLKGKNTDNERAAVTSLATKVVLS